MVFSLSAHLLSVGMSMGLVLRRSKFYDDERSGENNESRSRQGCKIPLQSDEMGREVPLCDLGIAHNH